MPRRERPASTTRSEHWMRICANEKSSIINERIISEFVWLENDEIEWLAPIKSDDYAEYYDQEFLELLGVKDLKVPLSDFWPKSGPRWDGLARTKSGKLILVEAKAYIEEGVDFKSQAGPKSMAKIKLSLEEAKKVFKASKEASWEQHFYQYANRLAHLYFLHELNDLDAYLIFLYFANATDVPKPCTVEQWQGAIRLTEKCLGLGNHKFRNRITSLIIDVPKQLSNISVE